MSHSNGKITAPINLDGDVYATLGIGSVNGAYDLGYACANTHGKINPWARYKPVRYESLAPGENEKWWQGWDGNCGVKPKRISSYTDAENYADGSMNGWEYTPPTGGKFPFRLTDFNGYNHRAQAPINKFMCPTTASNQFNSSSFTCSAAIVLPSEGHDTDYLNMGDFSEIAECYFGVYVKHKTSQMYRRVTADKKIGTGYAMVTVKSWGMATGDWEVSPFLSTAILNQDDPDIAHLAYSIPMMKKAKIEIVGSYVSISILGGMMPSIMRYIEVTVRVRNNSSSLISFSNNNCMARYASKKFEDPLTIGESSERIEDFSVSANSSIDKKVRIFISSDLIQSGRCRVWVSLNSAAYKDSTLLLSMGPSL
jgi:hypothetical protein